MGKLSKFNHLRVRFTLLLSSAVFGHYVLLALGRGVRLADGLIGGHPDSLTLLFRST